MEGTLSRLTDGSPVARRVGSAAACSTTLLFQCVNGHALSAALITTATLMPQGTSPRKEGDYLSNRELVPWGTRESTPVERVLDLCESTSSMKQESPGFSRGECQGWNAANVANEGMDREDE